MYTHTVEESLILSITDLKRLGYLSECKQGSLYYKSGTHTRSSFSLIAFPHLEQPYIYLSYEIKGQSPKSYLYKIPLERFPSNLGIGYRFYFQCPKTGKRCTKLYLPLGETIFAHRTHWKGLLYHCQTESKRWRPLFAAIRADEKMQALSGRYRKQHYQGKLTRPFCRLLAWEKRAYHYAYQIHSHIRDLTN